MTTCKWAMLLASSFGLLLAGCLNRTLPPASVEQTSPPPREEETHETAKERLKELTPDVRDVVKANDDFALDLYSRLARAKPKDNLFFSPYSVSSALVLVAEGARGETAEEMGKVLRYGDRFRRQGDDARMQPWEMNRMHSGMAALNDHFAGGGRPAPREVRARLDALHKQLTTADAQARELQKKGKWQEAETAVQRARATAEAINKLQVQYNQYELRIANALWGDKTYRFKQSYLDTLDKHYHTGGLYAVDFRNDFDGARQRINAWVEERTRHRIKEMLPPSAFTERDRQLLRLILTNAVYFKGEWAEVFSEAQTKDGDFVLGDGTRVRLPMMAHDGMEAARYAAFRGDGTFFDTPARIAIGQKDTRLLYPDDNGFQMLELPYKGKEMAMVVLLPRSPGGVDALEKKLTRAKLRAWIDKLAQREVQVFLPRFKLETKYALANTLQDMGMKRVFRNPAVPGGAQLDGISESADPAEKLYVSAVLHKAFVEVNEKGTEAAAATAISALAGAAPPIDVPFTPVFKADHPFVFLIRDVKTGSILFLGRLTNPKQS